ncbi:hypothetical protein Tco_0422713 [Tanacetum coccineum]
MEEMLNKFIDEGKQEREEMRAFIYDFQTNNELLFKERNNSLIELRFGVQELLNIINNFSMIDCDVKGVTTRGGKTTTQDNGTHALSKDYVVVEPEKLIGSNEVLTNDQPQRTSEPVVQPLNETQTPPVPFPRRLRKEKEEAQQKKFLENLKQLHINLPFIEALAQMPKYAKFLKILLNKLPSKEKDPGSFTIPLDIGQLHIDNALTDLGATISLMPYTMYKKLGLGEPKATRMSLELTDRIDDLDEMINVEAQMLLTNKEPDSFLSRGLEKSINPSNLECCESTSRNEKNGSDSENSIQCINSVNTPYPVTQGITNGDDVKCEHLYSASAKEIDEKKPELKNFPQHLEYAYLHGDKSFPIIISLELSEKGKTSLLLVLERRKWVIAWKMLDIKGISPSYCTYNILMEDDYKPVIQPQRRLNSKVQDVVKNEIKKLLDSGLIYCHTPPRRKHKA